MSLFLSTNIYDATQNFFTILTVWTKIVHTASGEDNHCPHCYWCGQQVKKVLARNLVAFNKSLLGEFPFQTQSVSIGE